MSDEDIIRSWKDLGATVGVDNPAGEIDLGLTGGVHGNMIPRSDWNWITVDCCLTGPGGTCGWQCS